MFRAFALLASLCSLVLLPTPPLAAQGNCAQCDLPPGCRGNGNAKKRDRPECRTLDITVQSDINFGRLVVIGDGVGEVVLDLSSGTKIISGGLNDLGGWSIRGAAVVTGAPFEPVLISFPSTITMNDMDGSTAQLRDFTTDLSSGAVLDGDGRLSFEFTGTLYTDASVANGGTLRGRVPISVSYP